MWIKYIKRKDTSTILKVSIKEDLSSSTVLSNFSYKVVFKSILSSWCYEANCRHAIASSLKKSIWQVQFFCWHIGPIWNFATLNYREDAETWAPTVQTSSPDRVQAIISALLQLHSNKLLFVCKRLHFLWNIGSARKHLVFKFQIITDSNLSFYILLCWVAKKFPKGIWSTLKHFAKCLFIVLIGLPTNFILFLPKLAAKIANLLIFMTNSVTIFGKISPVWPIKDLFRVYLVFGNILNLL